jgi:hypothetical protein
MEILENTIIIPFNNPQEFNEEQIENLFYNEGISTDNFVIGVAIHPTDLSITIYDRDFLLENGEDTPTIEMSKDSLTVHIHDYESMYDVKLKAIIEYTIEILDAHNYKNVFDDDIANLKDILNKVN